MSGHEHMPKAVLNPHWVVFHVRVGNVEFSWLLLAVGWPVLKIQLVGGEQLAIARPWLLHHHWHLAALGCRGHLDLKPLIVRLKHALLR